MNKYLVTYDAYEEEGVSTETFQADDMDVHPTGVVFRISGIMTGFVSMGVIKSVSQVKEN